MVTKTDRLSLSVRVAYLDLDGPREVTDVDEESNVGAVSEIKVLIGKAFFELFNVAPRDDGDLLSGLGARWVTNKGQRWREKIGIQDDKEKRRRKGKGKRQEYRTKISNHTKVIDDGGI